MRSLLALALVLACGPRPQGSRPTTIAPAEPPAPEEVAVAPEGEPPTGPLPRDVVPTHYRLGLTVVPDRHGFHGTAEIDVTVERPTRHIWIHGNRLSVRSAHVTPAGGESIEAQWEQLDDEGVAVLRLRGVLPAGEATIRIEYDAPFNRALRGLYRVDEGGHSYAFTQFEATSARLAFPSFDEPAFKTPFDVTLTVRRDHVAVFNTPAAEETQVAEDLKRVRFETTRPMPTYLVALAVGPLDVVEHEAIPPSALRDRPIPLRGLAARGKGPQLAYALANVAQMVQELEAYFDIAYPYRKLDIAAVPDFAAGAMENVGLITFRETLLLLGDDPPEWQKRAYHYVMAHELAHQWFGNLVTMPWWDDIWLNEAFATWMGQKVVQATHPEFRADLSSLQSVHYAMGVDSLATARQIRQPIESNHDIRNAFDAITYRKGGGVLSMFEQWMTPEVFRRGIRAYMREHQWGTATYADLLDALSEASGRDVATPFRTFLFQPGVPFLSVRVACSDDGNRVHLAQSRYLPVGSQGDRSQRWQFPACMRYGAGSEPQTICTLVQEAEQEQALDVCPRWIHPNADGAGYFRFGLEADQLARLRDEGWSQLTDREKLALTDSLHAAFDNATLTAADLYGSLEPLARSPIRPIATAPMGSLRFAHDHLVEEPQRPAVRRFAQRLYAPVQRRLGWEPRADEDGEVALLRASVIDFMATFVEDRRTRREAVRRAHRFLGYGRRGDGQLHRDAVDPNLVDTVLRVAVQDGDAAFFDRVLELFVASDDSLLRGQLLGALGSARAPELAERALALTLDERVRVNEMWTPLRAQLRLPERRDATWAWITQNFDALAARLEAGAGRLPAAAGVFCSEERAAEVEAFFADRIAELPGGPRNLANVLEEIRLCAAKVEAQRQSAQDFFGRRR